jgi:hypothetical protein
MAVNRGRGVLVFQSVVVHALLVVVAEEEGFGEEHDWYANDGDDCEESLQSVLF